MIAHVVLFRAREDLSAEARRRLAEAFGTAVRTIPTVRAVRVGRRVTVGRAYEVPMRDYPYLAIIEFDDVEGLQAYLDHAAHGALAERFFASAADMLVYDFDVKDGEGALEPFSTA